MACLFEGDRAQKGDDQQAHWSTQDDGEGSGMEDHVAPLLILLIVWFAPQASLDEHEWGAAKCPLYGSLHNKRKSEMNR